MSAKKSKNIQAALTVTRKEYITPHYIRVYLTGKDIELFDNTTIGVNNKILIPPKGLNEIHFPEFDYENMRWVPQSDEVRPYVRTYTHRGIDLNSKEIWIDFVAHGDEGPASAWAISAEKGDVIGVMMHDGKSELYSQAKSYVLVGDATAIPVISAILEDLPESAKGVCVLEVHDREDVQKIKTKADIHFLWLFNTDPQKGSELFEVVKGLSLPEEYKFGYVAAEFSTVKNIRNYLRKELHWGQEELYAYSYWKSGIAEDASAADRRKEKESVD